MQSTCVVSILSGLDDRREPLVLRVCQGCTLSVPALVT